MASLQSQMVEVSVIQTTVFFQILLFIFCLYIQILKKIVC